MYLLNLVPLDGVLKLHSSFKRHTDEQKDTAWSTQFLTRSQNIWYYLLKLLLYERRTWKSTTILFGGTLRYNFLIRSIHRIYIFSGTLGYYFLIRSIHHCIRLVWCYKNEYSIFCLWTVLADFKYGTLQALSCFEKTQRHACRQADRRTDKQTVILTDRQTDVRAERETQIDRHRFVLGPRAYDVGFKNVCF